MYVHVCRTLLMELEAFGTVVIVWLVLTSGRPIPSVTGGEVEVSLKTQLFILAENLICVTL